MGCSWQIDTWTAMVEDPERSRVTVRPPHPELPFHVTSRQGAVVESKASESEKCFCAR